MEQTEATIEKTISEQFTRLPRELQVLLTTTPWTDTIDGIAKKFSLTEEQTSDLRQETYFVLLGMERLSLFRSNLIRALEITYDQSIKITSEINDKILNPVMDNLKKIESQILRAESGEEEALEEELSQQKELQEEISKKTSFVPQNVKGTVEEARPPRTVPDTNPEHLVPDHVEMEKLDGPHLHSQTVMPTEQKPEPKPNLASRFGTFIPQTKKSFGSIVDEKLSRIVTSNSQTSDATDGQINPATKTPTQSASGIQSPQKSTYTGQDPYREPLE